MNERQHLRSQIGSVTALDLDEISRTILELVDKHDDILLRTCRPAHLTGSALVLERGSGRILLLFHTKLQRWLQPGGHADGESDLARVALREATEETGSSALEIVLPAIDLDVHTVDPPSEDAHLHLDVRFLVLAEPGAAMLGNHESEELRWVRIGDLATMGCDAGLQRLAAAGLKLAVERGFVA